MQGFTRRKTGAKGKLQLTRKSTVGATVSDVGRATLVQPLREHYKARIKMITILSSSLSLAHSQ